MRIVTKRVDATIRYDATVSILLALVEVRAFVDGGLLRLVIHPRS
jgi:hypothetical protein